MRVCDEPIIADRESAHSEYTKSAHTLCLSLSVHIWLLCWWRSWLLRGKHGWLTQSLFYRRFEHALLPVTVDTGMYMQVVRRAVLQVVGIQFAKRCGLVSGIVFFLRRTHRTLNWTPPCHRLLRMTSVA